MSDHTPSPHGFQKAPTEPDHWIFGQGQARRKFGAAALMENGHGWRKYKVDTELQNNGFLETMACSIFGSLNCWETLIKFYGITDLPKNCSDRFSAILANISPTGTDPHQSCESIRTTGVIEEKLMPFLDSIRTWAAYYSPKPPDIAFVEMGLDTVKRYLFGHEWVFNGPRSGKAALLMAALARGPVAVSLYAWRKNEDGMYFMLPTDQDNHWVQLLDYEEGKYWLIYDQYDKFEKKVAWNTDFYCAKLYFLTLRTELPGLIERLQTQLIALMQQLANLLMLQKYPNQQMPDQGPSMTVETTFPAPVAPPVATPPVITPPMPETLSFATAKQAYHAVRVLCDNAGLATGKTIPVYKANGTLIGYFAPKDILCACIFQESRFNNAAINRNKNGAGVVLSTDWGIAQINDYYHIGAGKDFPSVDYVKSHPEEVIKWMIGMYKKGQLKQWVSYSAGAYKQWLLANSPMWLLK